MKAATNEKAIEQLAPPAEVVIPMSMHFGAPCTPLVKAGDLVKVGQKIGEFRGLGAPIHASVSGKVKAVEPRPYSMGGNMTSVIIENDFQNTLSEEVQAPSNPDALTAEEMVEIVKNAGIVGMGGATFPTHVKISGGIGKVDTVIINGAECEPYITGDHRTMLERPEEIIGGATYLAKMFGVDKVVIGVEDNKQNGIDAMNKVIAEKKAPVVVEPLHCRYPQGGEKQLCQAITGKQVPPGGLPSNIGCAVFNINTTCCIFRAVTQGMPVVNKVVTVSGSGIVEPKNIECPIGTPVSLLLNACGGVKDGTYKEQTVENPQCIRCGKCVSVCPMHLEPLFMYQYASKGMVDELNDAHIMDCMECGACAYACPARMHLTHMFKTGKQLVKDKAAADKAAAEAKKAAQERKEA